MKTVKVNLGKRSYNIYIGKNIIKQSAPLIKPLLDGMPLFVITNPKVNRLHGKKLKKILGKLSKRILFHKIPDSEKAKSFGTYLHTVRRLACFARRIKPVVFAFGGGVVGDLAGFVASTYRRGVPYIQMPTTLLGQVDSAIGGKVAIDIKEAKNLVGSFYQPKAVFCDLCFLKTLPKKEVSTALPEIVKYGVISDRKFFSFLEKNVEKILKFDSHVLEYAVFKSCCIKARIVEKDEFDVEDLRAALNFGHTIGHAIEAASGYSKKITHGQAVAKGMVMASFIALKLKILKTEEYEKICALVNKIPYSRIKLPKLKNVLNSLSYDKKFTYGTNRFVLPESIGRVRVVDNIPLSLIKTAIKAFS